MFYVKSMIFYSIKFLMLLFFSIINLFIIDGGDFSNILVMAIFVIYYAIITNGLEFKITGYRNELISNKLIVRIISSISRLLVAFILLSLLMNYSYLTVFFYFVAEYFLKVLNGYTVTEFITLSTYESIEE